MMTLNHMATFAAVVKQGSFTAAAQSLGLSKPVVSKQITQLEQSLGVRLLNRTTRRLHLTEAGEVFNTHCQSVVTQANIAEQAVAPLQKDPCGTLMVTAPQCLALSLFQDLLPAFQDRYPRITLDMNITGEMVDLVEQGIDVALRIGELMDSSLMARRLGPFEFVTCASPEYLKNAGQPEHPRDLLHHNCLLYSEKPAPNHWFFADTNEDADDEPIKVSVSGNLLSDDALLLKSAALAGQGIMTGPTFMFEEELASGRLQSILSDYKPAMTSLYAVYPFSKNLSPKVRVFVDYLVEHWKDF